MDRGVRPQPTARIRALRGFASGLGHTSWFLCALVLLGSGCVGHRSGTYRPPPHPPTTPDEMGKPGSGGERGPQVFDETAVAPENKEARDLGLPTDARRCYDRLWHGGVTFELVYKHADDVRMPIRVTSPIGGVWVQPANGNRVNAIMDCRLAVRLLSWAPALRKMGVRTLEHYSAYRPNATISGSNRPSAHAGALALDLAKLHMDNGDVLDVLTDWEGRERGEAPCPRRRDEGWASRVLRTLVCDAIDRRLFQVVLTPHHDKAHQNHVHLELRPSDDWTFIR